VEDCIVNKQNEACTGFDVSVIGLGAMGTLMAQALLKQGKRVALWNRSPGKAHALVAAGACLCDSVDAALSASPVAIVVLLDNAAAQVVLGAAGSLAERTIVNFTTDSQDESLAMQALVNRAGGRYVKGMIVAYPRNVGHPSSHCLYTGELDAFERHRPLLEVLAGHTAFLPLEEALAFATVLHAHAFAAMVTFYEAVGASQRFGLPLAKTAGLLRDASRFFIADALDDAVRRLEQEDFAGDHARLDMHASAFGYIAESLHAQGAWTPVFDAVCQVVQRAESMGHGDQDIAATALAFAEAGQ